MGAGGTRASPPPPPPPNASASDIERERERERVEGVREEEGPSAEVLAVGWWRLSSGITERPSLSVSRRRLGARAKSLCVALRRLPMCVERTCRCSRMPLRGAVFWLTNLPLLSRSACEFWWAAFMCGGSAGRVLLKLLSSEGHGPSLSSCAWRLHLPVLGVSLLALALPVLGGARAREMMCELRQSVSKQPLIVCACLYTKLSSGL
mmetsp:Transcript_49785/g.73136  ORF Transcript_49785/g.73136 Transcript_49785/m.73136 type:complete len:207 (+) Transcript_49785:782-1402(+)